MSWFMELIEVLAKLVIPPPEAARKRQYVYRLRVTLVACSAFCGLWIMTALALGWFPVVFPGFARADELRAFTQQTTTRWQSITNSDNEHWALQVADSLLQMDQKRCALPAGELRQLYDTLIQHRMVEYQKLTGETYALPSCSDL